MTNVRIRFVAVLLGVLGCLAAGSAQSFAAPAPDAAPVASPASDEACGTLTASVSMSSGIDKMWASGSVLNACAGWDKLCVTLLNGSAQPIQTRCSSISTGSSIGISTPQVTCTRGWYYGQTKAYDNGIAVRQKTSERKLFNC